jgi:hypothetical protein
MGDIMAEQEMVEWICPNCEDNVWDFPNQYTHCGRCGEVVWVGYEDGMIDDQHWKVDVEKDYKS